jgi:ferredoxin
MYCSLCVEVCPVNCIYHTEEIEVQAYNRLELARQFGERPVDPTIDPKPAVKKKKSPLGRKLPGPLSVPEPERPKRVDRRVRLSRRDDARERVGRRP